MIKDKRKNNGGFRPGSGRKKAEELGIEKKKGYMVYLTTDQKEKILDRFSSLTKAIESLLK